MTGEKAPLAFPPSLPEYSVHLPYYEADILPTFHDEATAVDELAVLGWEWVETELIESKLS